MSNLSNIQFKVSQMEEEPWTEHMITAHKGKKQVGYLHYGNSGGVIDINVEKEHQRQGIATGMWNHAINIAGTEGPRGVRLPYPEHSANRTPSGEKWAKSTGKAHYFPPEEIH